MSEIVDLYKESLSTLLFELPLIGKILKRATSTSEITVINNTLEINQSI